MERLTFLPGGRRLQAAAVLLAFSCLIGATDTASAAGAMVKPYVTVRAKAVLHALQAYGQVEPIAVVQVRAAGEGTLSDMRVVPGSVVKAGEVLARIGGPRMQSLLIAREQALRSATAREDAANSALHIVRHQLAVQLATRQAVDAAQSDSAAARAAVRTASAQLQEIHSLQTVQAPAAGTVLAVQAADGEQLASGQSIVTLQPTGKLWVRAAYYGADVDLLHIGMTGRFQPSGYRQPVPVKVVALSSALASDGGLRIGLAPTTPGVPRWWINGQWGKLTLEGPTTQMVMVPTQSLILDRGHWWVLLHTPAGNKPQQVVPGPTHGWETAIASGLEPGQLVVATDAFLEYHRGIASHYTPPD
ncbi:MAG: HlyD family efflux transporter periplasmic adaptor subunit [Betaproteobacteria bacterium]|nr:HlyD family efflux transporter periplasmic adaptor subunit [Betaproteobacteria bacterium]